MKKKYSSPIIIINTVLIEDVFSSSSSLITDELDLREVIQRYDYEELEGESQDFFIT